MIGPERVSSALHTANVCDVKEIPLIDINWMNEPRLSSINMYPTHDTLSELLIQLLRIKNWGGFTILFESPSWIARVNSLLELYPPKSHTVTVRQLKSESDTPNFRSVLKKIRKSQDNNIILECSINILEQVLNQVNVSN